MRSGGGGHFSMMEGSGMAKEGGRNLTSCAVDGGMGGIFDNAVVTEIIDR